MHQTAVVAQIDDLQDGEMRQVKVGETPVLLVRLKGQFHAVGAHCTHYQAPLAKGVLHNDHVVCPWHHACFNVITGDQLEPPGLDSLPCYTVEISDQDVKVTVPEAASEMRSPTMAEYNPEADQRTFVILGAGAAGAHAAETLRVAGYQGRILMVTKEDQLPYDRTWLSKDYFTGKATKAQLPLRSSEFYQAHHIEILYHKEAVQVNPQAKQITFADQETLKYDALLLATGGKPRQLEIPGQKLANIFTLRSFSDTEQILAAAQPQTQAVVIGSSFIGMEAAAGLTKQGVNVTVVSPDTVPFESTLGKQIGQVFQQVHEENGVSFTLERKATQFEGDGSVEAVILDNGVRLPADLVVVGIGVQPATEILQGVELNSKDQSVPVDQYLRAADGLYAAGDIARYRDQTGESIRVEHWRIAAQQGRVAARNMAGQAVPFKAVPIFWTMQFNFPLRYVGHATEWDEIIVDGELRSRKFIAFYIKDNQIIAAASSQRDTETAALHELMLLDQLPTPDELRRGSIDLVGRVSQASKL